MAKQLILLRHAKSNWGDAAIADIDRPLSPRGEKAARLIGQYMVKHKWRSDLVLCSPARRTRDTLALVEAAFGTALESEIEPGLYLAEPSALLALVRAAPEAADCLMLVGHDPGLPGLATALLKGQAGPLVDQLKNKFPTGALAVLSCESATWRELKAGACRLEAFVVPRDL
ncbi:MAG: histidine phosphatase family protein [Alphaproteobacteria bacterium]|nr:histidine phosphatase family protein [Alphaproteobacteria bacterium]